MPLAFITAIAGLNEPLTVGVPESVAVEVVKVIPDGNAPVSLHINGPDAVVEAVNVTGVYAVPAVPAVSVVDVGRMVIDAGV